MLQWIQAETQQALGRLLGLSVSVVSRFEAAAERPDQATHRRYCALAPTEELRERATAAYVALPATAERHAAPIRRSPEEWHGRALDGPGLYQFFEAAYSDYPALRLFGDEAKPLPVWVEAGCLAGRVRAGHPRSARRQGRKGRNHALNRAAFRLGQLVAAGLLDPETVLAGLLEAATACGLGESEATATIESGLAGGTRKPRQGLPNQQDVTGEP